MREPLPGAESNERSVTIEAPTSARVPRCQAAADGSPAPPPSSDPVQAAEPQASARADSLSAAVRVQSVATSGLFILAAFYTVHFAKPILMPVVAAVILYALLWPLVRLFANLHIPPPLGALIVVAGLVGGAGTGIYFLAGPATSWLDQAPEALSEIRAKIKAPVQEIRDAKRQVANLVDPDPASGPAPVPDNGGLVLGVTEAAVSVLGVVQQVGISLLIIVALLYLLLASGTLFQLKLVRSLSSFRHKKQAVEITNQIQKDIAGYLGTVTLINSGLGVAIGLGLYLAGIPNPVLWGTMAALLNFVPYIGLAIGATIVSIVGLLTFDLLTDALIPAAVYITCNAIEANFITPMLLSQRLTLNAVVVFLSVILWGWLWGISGALMAVPMLAVLKVVADRVDGLAPLSDFLGGRGERPEE